MFGRTLMTQEDKYALLRVMLDAKSLISRPGNDFAWSRWENSSQALQEISNIEKEISDGDFSHLRDLELLFAPTGSLQELSLSSGWAEEYLILAKRFDEAVRYLQHN